MTSSSSSFYSLVLSTVFIFYNTIFKVTIIIEKPVVVFVYKNISGNELWRNSEKKYRDKVRDRERDRTERETEMEGREIERRRKVLSIILETSHLNKT